MDLTSFAADVGRHDPLAIAGLGTRSVVDPGLRCVHAPSGIESIEADEMTVCCGAATPIDDLAKALAELGQRVALPSGGTVGGALALGQSGIRRLGDGPVRETLLQARYVNAAGDVVKAGGPTVKNVSGFDVCRLLVGSRGTLGFLGEVILRTRPVAAYSQWFRSDPGVDPLAIRTQLYHPVSVLWDGSETWVLLEGHEADVHESAVTAHLTATEGPPPLPLGYRWSLPVRQLRSVPSLAQGRFVAEIGVGVVHHQSPAPPRSIDPVNVQLQQRIKAAFDPTNRLNPTECWATRA